MPPRKPRSVKSAAPSPSPARSMRSRSQVVSESGASESTAASTTTAPTTVPETVEESEYETEADHATEDEVGENDDNVEEGAEDDDEEEAAAEGEDGEQAAKKTTLEERQAKLRELRLRMNKTTAENRKDLVADHQKSKVTAKELARLEKHRKLAKTLRLKAEAEEEGEDLERRKAWEWSIEQNERWEAKLAEQAERSDTNFHNSNDDAFKKYRKNVRQNKPDLVAYSRQKEAAMGLEPGTLAPIGATSSQLAAAGPSKASSSLTAHEDLYRNADTLNYGDQKPSEDAIDRVIGSINKGMAKRNARENKRKDNEDDGGDVTYINKRNKVFNKKIARYFDKYTKEIRQNLERGTAL